MFEERFRLIRFFCLMESMQHHHQSHRTQMKWNEQKVMWLHKTLYNVPKMTMIMAVTLVLSFLVLLFSFSKIPGTKIKTASSHSPIKSNHFHFIENIPKTKSFHLFANCRRGIVFFFSLCRFLASVKFVLLIVCEQIKTKRWEKVRKKEKKMTKVFRLAGDSLLFLCMRNSEERRMNHREEIKFITFSFVLSLNKNHSKHTPDKRNERF